MGAPLKSILLEWGFLFARASARVEGWLTAKGLAQYGAFLGAVREKPGTREQKVPRALKPGAGGSVLTFFYNCTRRRSPEFERAIVARKRRLACFRLRRYGSNYAAQMQDVCQGMVSWSAHDRRHLPYLRPNFGGSG